MKLLDIKGELKEFLDEKVEKYNQPDFIEHDPIQIPHQFSKKEDIEIIGFLTATIAWGKREMIIRSANRILDIMDHDPYEFILNHTSSDLQGIQGFKHRTFNSVDLSWFFTSLQNIYKNKGGLECVFSEGIEESAVNMRKSIAHFNAVFFENVPEINLRTRKHVSNPEKGSAAKRINMYLRWMVRNDAQKVDFGIWKSISPALLSCPLDVHTGNVGRLLEFITRKQNDWKTVTELDSQLRRMDANDPVKYDFALFGLGVFEGWK